MSTNHHTPIATGAARTAAVVNAPLSALDTAITTLDTDLNTAEASIALLLLKSNPVQGGMLNGKIVTSVTSNNLKVEIKTLANADPSGSDPVYVRIGNSVRTLTAALSVTKNAGTNWCNAGASELATLEIDYFVYLGYNATDGVTIGFSRIPTARTYGDFSTTSTNEKYAAISTITNAASTDEYELVGRFNAVLSAGAGYTWSIPATSIVISRPVYETRWLTWVPTLTGFSANPTDTNYRYQIAGSVVRFSFSQQTAGTSNATTFTATLPMAPTTATNASWHNMCGSAVDNGSTLTTPARYTITYSGGSTMSFYKDTATGTWTNSGGKRAIANGWYEI